MPTVTVQNVIDAARQDLMRRIGTSHSALIDYVNRVQLELLRFSNWKFTESAPQRFLTEKGQVDYWIGVTASPASGTVNTELNLTDVGRIREGTVRDRTNSRPLSRVNSVPTGGSFEYPDGTPRLAKPLVWKNSPDTPNIINIYPPGDNTNTYAPVPVVPGLSNITGGFSTARVVFVQVSIQDTAVTPKESALSTEVSQTVLASKSLSVTMPPMLVAKNDSGVTYIYNVYASLTSGTEKKVGTIAATGGSLTVTEAAISGATKAYPASGGTGLAPFGGYVIEFRYFKTRPQLAVVGDILTIPDEYKDVVIAGVNYYAGQLTDREQDAAYWRAAFEDGKRQMYKDTQLTPDGRIEFVHPDPVSSSANPSGGLGNLWLPFENTYQGS